MEKCAVFPEMTEIGRIRIFINLVQKKLMSETNNIEMSGHADSTIPETLKEKLHQCEAVCREVEALAGRPDIDIDLECERLKAKFDEVTDLPPEFEELLRKKFDSAVKSLALAAEDIAKRDAEFKKIKVEIESLAAAGELATLKEVEQLEKKCQRFAENNRDTSDAVSLAFSVLIPLRDRLAAEAEQERLISEKADALTAELTALAEAEDAAPLHENKPRIEEEYAKLGKVPAAAAKRYSEAHRQAAVKLARHYETLDLARWESYTLKLDLCKKLEELSQLPEKEMINVSKQLQEIREKWKSLGSVPKEKSEEINPRYLELTRELQHKVDEFYSRRRQEQKIAAAEKQKLCDRAAELANSTDWAAAANEFKDMQKQWKALPGAGTAEHDLFSKFRASADIFFNARGVVLAERDRKFKEASDAKEALIKAAENLAPGSVREAKKLREEFQKSPAAGRAEPELRRRFDAAMNNFFNALKDEFSQKENSARTLLAELEKLTADPLGSAARVREIREEFRNLSCRATIALERAALDKFNRAFDAARKQEKAGLFTGLRPLAMQLAAAIDDENAPLPDDAVLEKYPRLRTAAKIIVSVRSGESGAAEKLEKQLAAARNEHKRIISALEAAVAVPEEKPLSLAAELEAAILGNFAAGSANGRKQKNTADPSLLKQDFLNAGLLPADELAASFDRFDSLFAEVSAKQ